jgi:hypothetical protein
VENDAGESIGQATSPRFARQSRSAAAQAGSGGRGSGQERDPYAARILRTATRLAVPRGLNHLLDDLLQLAIDELR